MEYTFSVAYYVPLRLFLWFVPFVVILTTFDVCLPTLGWGKERMNEMAIEAGKEDTQDGLVCVKQMVGEISEP